MLKWLEIWQVDVIRLSKSQFIFHIIWGKAFKNGPSKICEWQPLKNLKWYDKSLVHSWILCPTFDCELVVILNFVFQIETSHSFCWAKQLTGFYIKCNTGVKWVNLTMICPSKYSCQNHVFSFFKQKLWWYQPNWYQITANSLRSP